MNIGDKVRLIHSKGEGIITKILRNDQVEVELEDGFSNPFLRKELALVSRVEEKYFTPTANQSDEALPTTNQIKAKTGIYLSFVPINGNRYLLYLINNTDYHLPFCLTVLKDGSTEGVGAGYLTSKNSINLKEFDNQNFENWGTFIFDCFYYRAKSFADSKTDSPIINQKGYLLQLDLEELAPINADEIKNKMFGVNDSAKSSIDIAKKPSAVIDLHIEELEKNSLDFNHKKPILEIQLAEFERSLESAIAHGMDEITFIHGIGNGVLRDEIHRKLGRHKNVAYFKDAQKDKFGYGATLAKIK
jgi:Smr domain/Domain of unknown function (DUF2027)